MTKGRDTISHVSDFNLVINAARKSKSVIISGHQNPDGDAVGSCFALALAFANLDIKPIVMLEPYSARYDFITGSQYLSQNLYPDNFIPDTEVAISLDCANKERLGPGLEPFEKASIKVVIDHHVSNSLYGTVNIIDEKASSTCELLLNLLDGSGVEITPDIASALFAGIITDTGGFRHNSTTPRTFLAAARLLETGIDISQIQRQAVYEHSPVEASVFALAVGGMRIVPELKLAVAGLTHDQMWERGATGTDLDGIAEYMLNTRGIEVSALLSERKPGLINISLRSTELNVNKIAGSFSGGGHVNAAGCRISGDIPMAIETIIQAVRTAYAT